MMEASPSVEPRLFEAIKSGSLDQVIQACDQGDRADTLYSDLPRQYKITPLHYSIHMGKKHITRYLIGRFGVHKLVDNKGDTIMDKMYFADEDLFNEFSKQYNPIDFCKKNITLASEHNVNFCISYIATAQHVATLLFLASQYGAEAAYAIQELSKHQLWNVNVRNEMGDTALHLAAENCYHLVVKQLLDYGTEINTIDEELRTPLLRTIDNYSDEIPKNAFITTVRVLIERGAHVTRDVLLGLKKYPEFNDLTENENGDCMLVRLETYHQTNPDWYLNEKMADTYINRLLKISTHTPENTYLKILGFIIDNNSDLSNAFKSPYQASLDKNNLGVKLAALKQLAERGKESAAILLVLDAINFLLKPASEKLAKIISENNEPDPAILAALFAQGAGNSYQPTEQSPASIKSLFKIIAVYEAITTALSPEHLDTPALRKIMQNSVELCPEVLKHFIDATNQRDQKPRHWALFLALARSIDKNYTFSLTDEGRYMLFAYTNPFSSDRGPAAKYAKVTPKI